MPFQFETERALQERARRAFRTEMPGTDAWLWPNNIGVSAKVMGGMTHLNFLWLEYVAKQRWVHTSDGEFLDQHGFVYGIGRLPATFAQGTVTLTGTPGTLVPTEIQMQRADGTAYEVIESATVDGLGNVSLQVRAVAAGKAGNAVAGVGVALTAAFTGLDTEGVVHADGIGLGQDVEADESLRERILHRLRLPPHGGAAHDYVAWAREINGVTRVFVDPLADGPGTVTVYFLMDDTYTNGIPQAADVQAVQDFIDAVRPVTAVVTVAAPASAPVNVTISGLALDTQSTRDAIQLELADMFRREARVSTVADPYTLHRSKLWEAISQASGEDHHVLAAPAADVAYAKGQLPVLGTVTFG